MAESAGLKIKDAATICATVGFLVYFNSLDLAFSFDDGSGVVKNSDIRTNETTWFNLLTNDFWGTPMSSPNSHKSYRPLTVATFRLNYMLQELEPLGYHLVNVLLHCAVVYLYVLLCGVVFNKVWPALIAGLLFAVHSIHTEAVSGLVGRADVMAGAFLLLSIFSYRKSLIKKSTVWFAGSLLLVMCSALSKENGVMAISLCLAYDFLIHRKMNVCEVLGMIQGQFSPRRDQRLRQFLLRAVVCGVCVISFLYFRLRMNSGQPDLSYYNNPAMKFSTPYRQLHWSYLCVMNMWLLLSPSRLCAEYAMGTVPPIASLSDPRNLLTLTTFAALLSLSSYAASSRDGHHRKILFGLCLTVLPFLPASNLFFPVGFVIAERVLYIPSMGFCVLVAYGLWCAYKKAQNSKVAKAFITVVLLCLFLMLSFKTMVRNREWMNNSTLYRATCKISPRNPKMLNFLATSVLLPESKYDLAEKLYYYTIEVEPEYTSVYRNLGEMQRRIGKTTESIQVLREGAKVYMAGEQGENFYHTRNDIQVMTELAKNLQEYSNNYEEALQYAEFAIERRPRWVTPRRIKAMTLVKLGRVGEAEIVIEEALRIRAFSDGYLTKGDIMQARGEWGEAEKYYRKALEMNRDSAEAKMSVAYSLIENLKDESVFHEAELLLTQVLKTEMSSKAVYYFCELHRKGGSREIAKNYCNRSLQLDPNATGALYALGLFSFEEKNYEESVRLMRRLLTVSPDHLGGTVQLATSLMELGESSSEAKSLFLSVLSRDPGNLQALRHLGILHMRLNELTEAHSVLSQLVNLDPSDQAVARQLKILRQKVNSQTKDD